MLTPERDSENRTLLTLLTFDSHARDRYIAGLASQGLRPVVTRRLKRKGFEMSTYHSKPGELAPNWFVVDASGQVLGRLAAKLATVAQGKHKPTYTPHVESGDFVIVLNADKVVLTGRKAETKVYDFYSRYPGGRNLKSYRTMNELHPERALQLAVKRMLPKNKIGRNMLLKIKIYKGDKHGHSAQQPQPLAQAVA